ncbi:MAG: (d)CMP kinase [Candidatus Melainabacteria bacterium]|nr:(d)CMP kinase [Candidatus Melainabacteria bacterium]
MKKYIIAIDGPAGSGKSTIAKFLANELGFLYIDSGAMYRAVTLYMLERRLFKLVDKKLKKHLQKIKIGFDNKLVYLGNEDVTDKIRSSQVNKYVSEVSARKVVRKEMVKRQKEFGKHESIVMDGRDIGTQVFPHANLKIYLTASVEERARRRKKDMKKLGEDDSLSELIRQIYARDAYDSTRKISPLAKAQDAIVLDSTELSIRDVLKKIGLFVPYIKR